MLTGNVVRMVRGGQIFRGTVVRINRPSIPGLNPVTVTVYSAETGYLYDSDMANLDTLETGGHAAIMDAADHYRTKMRTYPLWAAQMAAGIDPCDRWDLAGIDSEPKREVRFHTLHASLPMYHSTAVLAPILVTVEAQKIADRTGLKVWVTDADLNEVTEVDPAPTGADNRTDTERLLDEIDRKFPA